MNIVLNSLKSKQKCIQNSVFVTQIIRLKSEITERKPDRSEMVKKFFQHDIKIEEKTKEEADKKINREAKRFKPFFDDEERNIEMIKFHEEYFDKNIKEKTRENFLAAIEAYKTMNPNKHRYIDFVYGALLKMKEYDCANYIEAYRKLLEIFPVGPLRVDNLWQRDNLHFPRQQTCAIQLFEQMERNGVMLDEDMLKLSIDIFGDWTHVVRKAKRQLYWLPKFKNANKYPLTGIDIHNPESLSKLNLAISALHRMTTVDVETKVRVNFTKELNDDQEDTWIAWAQSSEQRELLKKFDQKLPVYIEGPHFTWLKSHLVEYFVFKTDPLPEYKEKVTKIERYDEDDITNIENIYLPSNNKNKNIKPKLSVHEQDTGTIFGLCCTGTGTKNSLVSWTKILERTNESLKKIAIIYRVKNKPDQLAEIGNTNKKENESKN